MPARSRFVITLLSNNNMLGPKTVEPMRQLCDCDSNVRASRDADKVIEKQTCHQLMVRKCRRSVTRLSAIILSETNRQGHWSVLRLAVLKLKLVLKLGDVGTLEQVDRESIS